MFKELLKKQDYAAILELKTQAKDPLDHYAVFRAAIILGTIPENPFQVGDVLHEICRAQVVAYSKGRWKEGFEILFTVREKIEHRFLQADVNFIMGFFLFLQNLYNLCPPYLKTAIQLYELEGLNNHAGHAYFNLCLAYDHLRERALLDKMKASFKKNREGDISNILYSRLEACQALDREDYSSCLEIYSELIPKYKKLKRHRDHGAGLWVTVYLQEKLKKTLQIEIPEEISQAHRLAIEMLSAVKEGVSDIRQARSIKKHFERKGIVSSAIPYWLELVCEHFEAKKDFSSLLDWSIYSEKYCADHQQDPYLIDFKYYEILARLRLGDVKHAEYLLYLYEQDALQESFSARLKKAKQLRRLQVPASTFEVANLKLNIRLDLNRHVLTLNGMEKDLSKQPLIEKAVQALAKCPVHYGIEQFFSDVYGVEYRPWTHERRLSTLINRLRVLFGFKNAILRLNKEIQLDPRFQSIKIVAVQGRVGRDKRKISLLQKMKKVSTPISVSEIQKIFESPRRTLQLDLQELVRDGSLRATGIRRNKKYLINSNSIIT